MASSTAISSRAGDVETFGDLDMEMRVQVICSRGSA
jgi:hypothetical protein